MVMGWMRDGRVGGWDGSVSVEVQEGEERVSSSSPGWLTANHDDLFVRPQRGSSPDGQHPRPQGGTRPILDVFGRAWGLREAAGCCMSTIMVQDTTRRAHPPWHLFFVPVGNHQPSNRVGTGQVQSIPSELDHDTTSFLSLSLTAATERLARRSSRRSTCRPSSAWSPTTPSPRLTRSTHTWPSPYWGCFKLSP